MKTQTILATAAALSLAPGAAQADIIHRMSSSVQLTVDAAATQATRIGSTYSVAGNNVNVSTMGGLTAPASATAAATLTAGSYGISTSGSAFSLSESFTYGDSIPSGVSVSTGTVSNLPAYGTVTTTAGGVAGTLSGVINSAGITTITPGGAGYNCDRTICDRSDCAINDTFTRRYRTRFNPGDSSWIISVSV
jgi:hypothetical protein